NIQPPLITEPTSPTPQPNTIEDLLANEASPTEAPTLVTDPIVTNTATPTPTHEESWVSTIDNPASPTTTPTTTSEPTASPVTENAPTTPTPHDDPTKIGAL